MTYETGRSGSPDSGVSNFHFLPCLKPSIIFYIQRRSQKSAKGGAWCSRGRLFPTRGAPLGPIGRLNAKEGRL